MEEQERKSLIAKTLLDMARFYAFDLGERQLEMYVDVLINFPFDEFHSATKMYIVDPKNTKFPIPPHSIISKTTRFEADDESKANEIAGRIHEAVSKFGWPSPGRAKEYIGELGWRVVESYGGWNYICENLGTQISISTFRAQCRDSARSKMTLSKAFPENYFSEKPKEINQNNQMPKKISIEEIMLLVNSKDEK